MGWFGGSCRALKWWKENRMNVFWWCCAECFGTSSHHSQRKVSIFLNINKRDSFGFDARRKENKDLMVYNQSAIFCCFFYNNKTRSLNPAPRCTQLHGCLVRRSRKKASGAPRQRFKSLPGLRIPRIPSPP